MSDSDLERLNKLVGTIVGKRFIQAMSAVAVLAFGMGCWLTRMEGLYSKLADNQSALAVDRAEKLVDWNGWRERKNDKDHEQDVRIARVEEK